MTYTTTYIYGLNSLNNSFINNRYTQYYRWISTYNSRLQVHTINENLGLRKSPQLIPSINHARNNKRLANAVNALHAFIQIQADLPNSVTMALVNLIAAMESMYYNRPLQFVSYSKMLANWFKVNAFRQLRTQDQVPNVGWNSNVQVPHLLTEIFSSIAQYSHEKYTVFKIVRLTLSILNLYEVVTTPTQPKLETIISPGPDVNSVFSLSELNAVLGWLGIDPERLTSLFKFQNEGVTFHSSSSSGPNGQAVWHSHLDAKAIQKDTQLFGHLKQLALLLGRKDLLTVLEDAAKLPSTFGPEREEYAHSKLHFIFEKGDKTRTIAILDYFTQELLSPFHDLIADILKTIPQDGTFDQNAIAEAARLMTENGKATLYSLDLTAATDRLPVVLQRWILDNVIRIDGFGLLWQKVLTFREFVLPNGDKVKYSVGQPMGAKSSFPMLGLTHHIILQIAALRTGYTERFTDYVILGDDILIADEKVAIMYQGIMKQLGLEISVFKSIISTPSNSIYSVAEICKRYFVAGVELTPLPMKLIANVTEQGLLFFQLQEKMQERGLIMNKTTWKEFAAAIIRSDNDWKTIGLYNSMPTWLTGFKESFDFGTSGQYNYNDWKQAGITEEVLLELWKYTVIQEQFKRVSALIQAADDGFKAISKGIQLGNIVFVDNGSGSEIPKADFSLKQMQEWNILNVAHPARFVMLGEVNRISTIMQQIASVRGQALITKLLGSVVDSLKYSILEITRDEDIRNANLSRMLVQRMWENLKQSKKARENMLSFVVKLKPLNLVWILRFNLFGSCTLTRSVSNISTTQRDAQLKLQKFNQSSDDFKDLFSR